MVKAQGASRMPSRGTARGTDSKQAGSGSAGRALPRRILALDTATRFGGAALVEAGRVVAEVWIGPERSTSAHLLPLVQQLLAAAGWAREQIEAVAVTVGPGSFTGLRIGVTTAKALAYAWHVPVIGVTTLQVMAAQALWEGRWPGSFKGWLVPVIRSRRNEFYIQLFELPASPGTAASLRPAGSSGPVAWPGQAAPPGPSASPAETVPVQGLPQPVTRPEVLSAAVWMSGEWLRANVSGDLILIGDPSLIKELKESFPGEGSVLPETVHHEPLPPLIRPAAVGRVAWLLAAARVQGGEAVGETAMAVQPLYVARPLEKVT